MCRIMLYKRTFVVNNDVEKQYIKTMQQIPTYQHKMSYNVTKLYVTKPETSKKKQRRRKMIHRLDYQSNEYEKKS